MRDVCDYCVTHVWDVHFSTMASVIAQMVLIYIIYILSIYEYYVAVRARALILAIYLSALRDPLINLI